MLDLLAAVCSRNYLTGQLQLLCFDSMPTDAWIQGLAFGYALRSIKDSLDTWDGRICCLMDSCALLTLASFTTCTTLVSRLHYGCTSLAGHTMNVRTLILGFLGFMVPWLPPRTFPGWLVLRGLSGPVNAGQDDHGHQPARCTGPSSASARPPGPQN